MTDSNTISWACRQGRPHLCRVDMQCSRSHDPVHQAEIIARLNERHPYTVLRPSRGKMVSVRTYKRYGFDPNLFYPSGLGEAVAQIRGVVGRRKKVKGMSTK